MGGGRIVKSKLADYSLSTQKQKLEWEHATGLVHQWQKWVFNEVFIAKKKLILLFDR